eukprot:5162538-Alexandrium_andersonii.AAC.1
MEGASVSWRQALPAPEVEHSHNDAIPEDGVPVPARQPGLLDVRRRQPVQTAEPRPRPGGKGHPPAGMVTLSSRLTNGAGPTLLPAPMLLDIGLHSSELRLLHAPSTDPLQCWADRAEADRGWPPPRSVRSDYGDLTAPPEGCWSPATRSAARPLPARCCPAPPWNPA